MARGKPDHSEIEATPQSERLDKWIWHARFLRSRESCAELVRKGHVRLNSRRVTQPGHALRAGDVLTLALPRRTIVVEVTAFAARRAGAEAAQALYRFIEACTAAARA